MDLERDWRSSKLAYRELVYRPMIRSGYTIRESDPRKAVGRALTGASVNKGLFSLFTMGGALFPFVLYQTRGTTGLDISLEVTISLSILLVFGYLVLYCVQVLPSFVTTGSFAPFTILPIPAGEVSTVAALTLWRTLDYIVLASLASQLGAVLFFTGSPAATLVVAFASVACSLLAVGLALSLTTVFQRRLETGSLSGVRGLFRPLYFILWGLGVMSAVFLFSLISYASSHLVAALAEPASPLGLAVSLVLPFSAAIVATSLEGQAVSGVSLACGLVGLTAGGLLALKAARVITGAIGDAVLPPSREVARGPIGDGTGSRLSFSVRSPLSAYVLKDIRVSSRNPTTAFLFALPVFEIFAVLLPLTSTTLVRTAVILVGAQVGGGFALFVAFLLVTVEDLGVERRTALPFREPVRALSKVVVSTAAYLPVPLILVLVLAFKVTAFAGAALLPILTTGSVFGACVVEVAVLRVLGGAGRGAAARFALGIGSGELVLAAPAVAFSLDYILTHNHIGSLLVFALVVAVEVGLGALLLGFKRPPAEHHRSTGGQNPPFLIISPSPPSGGALA